MMGYTHAAWGAGGAVALAALGGDGSVGCYVIAATAGALGGAAIDIEVKDRFANPKMTDAGRTRLAVLGLIGIGLVLDYLFGLGVLSAIVTEGYVALGGLIAFLIFLLIGHFTPHRTFTHSLLFVIITMVCVGLINVDAAIYYLAGSLLHIILDLFNNKVIEGHGVWLLFPIRRGNGIAFGLCKAGGTGNKVLYFIGMILFGVGSALYVYQMKDYGNVAVPIILVVYMIIVMHFVRHKSEKQLRHIDHMHGK